MRYMLCAWTHWFDDVVRPLAMWHINLWSHHKFWLAFCKLNSRMEMNAILAVQKSIKNSVYHCHPYVSNYMQMRKQAVWNRRREHILYLLTPWCRVLLEKLTGLQLVKKFPHFIEPEGTLPHSQVSAACPYPGPAQSGPYTHIPSPGDPS